MESSCIDSFCKILRRRPLWLRRASLGPIRLQMSPICKMEAKGSSPCPQQPQLTSGSESRLALSALAPETFQSEIRAMTTECDRIGGINLAQGVCDTPVPAVVEAAAIEAIRDGQNIYTRCDGIARLREAIAAKQHARLRPALRPRERSDGGLRRDGRPACGGHGAAQSRRRGAALRAVLRLPRATRSSRCA